MCIKINLKERALVDCGTGDIVWPSCWEHLIPYHEYLVQDGQKSQAKQLLKRVFKGEKVISDMIKSSQDFHK